MTRVFLSFAAENRAFAARLAHYWERLRIDVFRFDAPERRGERFINAIESELTAADVFVALISRESLASDWCDRERQTAIGRESDLHGRQFVYLVRIDDSPRSSLGLLLRSYSLIDGRGTLTDARVAEITTAVRLDRRSVGFTDAGDPEAGFRNRDDELMRLKGALLTRGGHAQWVVVSPPLMGKSWLLSRLGRDLAAEGWSISLLDLRHSPVSLLSEPNRVVYSLLEIEGGIPEQPVDEADLRALAGVLSSRRGPRLFLLDSADLLSHDCAIDVRTTLDRVYGLVQQTGVREPVGLVVGTRRHEEWQGLGADSRAAIRFESVFLSEFSPDVVHQALLELPNDFGSAARRSHAERLHRLSEGLPALLVRSIRWAVDTGFLDMDRCGEQSVFDAVAREYIEQDLLSAESLLPMGAPRPREALVVLRGTLRALSGFRLYTLSHLKFLLAGDVELSQALDAARWSSDDLWEALRLTALHTQQAADEMWYEIEPALRRLLHRYHHSTDSVRSAVHVASRTFYGGWIRERAAGREQQIVLVECLWHEASRLVIEQPDDVPRLLLDAAVELAGTYGMSPMYGPREMTDAVQRRLRGDVELQHLLAPYRGLFDDLVKTVKLTIGGGA